jgi:hypothetical protein
MTTTEVSLLWVVYQVTIHGKPSGISAVCEQGEWDAMELARPGYHKLVLAGIPNEGEAERLARTGSGYDGKSKLSERKRSYVKREIKPTTETADAATGESAALVAPAATVTVP